jgi:hypothetical protein
MAQNYWDGVNYFRLRSKIKENKDCSKNVICRWLWEIQRGEISLVPIRSLRQPVFADTALPAFELALAFKGEPPPSSSPSN